MNATHLRLSAGHAERSDAPTQAERLLNEMHEVCSHDLPNQMVALQGLLHLLSQEESANLGNEGREFLRRLHNATRQASRMARFLKEMAALKTRTIRLKPIALADLTRELQGGLRHLYPTKRFTFAWDWQAPAIVGDSRILVQAILELFAGLSHAGAEECRLSASSQEHADLIELAFRLEEVIGSQGEEAPRPRAIQERLEIILAREWLALGGAGLDLISADHADTRFSLVVPNR